MKKTAMLKTIAAALIIVLSLQVFVFAEEQPQLLISPPAEQAGRMGCGSRTMVVNIWPCIR